MVRCLANVLQVVSRTTDVTASLTSRQHWWLTAADSVDHTWRLHQHQPLMTTTMMMMMMRTSSSDHRLDTSTSQNPADRRKYLPRNSWTNADCHSLTRHRRHHRPHYTHRHTHAATDQSVNQSTYTAQLLFVLNHLPKCPSSTVTVIK